MRRLLGKGCCQPLGVALANLPVLEVLGDLCRWDEAVGLSRHPVLLQPQQRCEARGNCFTLVLSTLCLLSLVTSSRWPQRVMLV